LGENIVVELTLEGCTNYLENNAFTNIEFMEVTNGNFYFQATDEDDEMQLVEFEPQLETERVVVSIKEGSNWIILEILDE
jgi:hypothetical protein